MSRLLLEFYSTTWAIIPDRLPVIRAVLERWESGVKLSRDEISAAVGSGPAEAARRRSQPSPRGIAVLPLLGILAQRTAGDTSTPGTATDTVRRHFADFLADDSVGTIMLDVDSPGGSVFGVRELAADIYAARGRKRVIAVANSLMASAAYWIGSAADEIVMAPGGQVGSIGVLSGHEDHSGELAQKGIKVELISAGRYKTERNPFEPLTADARADMQRHVDEYYDAFVGDVARFRGVKRADVINSFGQGRVVGSSAALAAGMVDRIGTFEQTLQRVFAGDHGRAPRAALPPYAGRSATPLRTRADRELALLEAEHGMPDGERQGAQPRESARAEFERKLRELGVNV